MEKKLATKDVIAAQSNFDRLLEYLSATLEIDFESLTKDHLVIKCQDDDEIKGHIYRYFFKEDKGRNKRGEALIVWYPTEEYKNWAHRREFRYSFIDSVDNTIDGINWFTKIKEDLNI